MQKNVLVVESRSVVMQQLLDAVVNGYTYYTNGSVRADRCARLVKRFQMIYQVDADRNARARRKRNGFGSAKLVLFHREGLVYWWLLITPPTKGDHAAHSLEKLRDAQNRDGRIEIDGFELVRLPRHPKDKPPQGQTDRPFTRLTWRMTERKVQDWRHSIINAVRKSSSSSLHQLTYQLWSSPGFGGIRSQIGKIAALYKAEVKRSGRADAPALPKRLLYVRRMKVTGMTLTQLEATSKESIAGLG